MGVPLRAEDLLDYLNAHENAGKVPQAVKTALEKKIAIPEKELLTLIKSWRNHARSLEDGRFGFRSIDSGLECREVIK
jgi:hypothetical protein